MDTKKHIKKINKVNPFILLAIGFVVGLAVMYLYFQPKLAYQEKTANKNQTLATQSHNEAVSYKGRLASVSAELKALQTAPTPTPEIKYVTQPKPAVKCTVMANAYTHFTECCDASGSCTSN